MTLPNFVNRRFVIGTATLAILVAIFALFAYGLEPANADVNVAPVIFEIKRGDGFRSIVKGLREAGLIRSNFVTTVFSVVSGSAFSLQAGSYRLSASMSAPEILSELASGSGREVVVTIPEGMNIYQIDRILGDARVIDRGELIGLPDYQDLEGKLFPDTYRFFANSDVKEVVQKFLNNFDEKAGPLLSKDPAKAKKDLIMASMVEKEVPTLEDQKIVAGILWKRDGIGMPLQADATICYAMQVAKPSVQPNCNKLDTKFDSPYNTYLNKGFPPSPIGNPGISAIRAAIDPTRSPYWYYLSDPKTGKTIFAKSLDEQHQNTVKYLERN